MEYLLSIASFFNNPFFIIIGGLTVAISALGILYSCACWSLGISPIIFRLGFALWKRRIAIFSDAEKFQSLKSTLLDSNVFKEKKIVHIQLDNIEKARNETIYLVDWETFGAKIEQVFQARYNHQTAVIIFAKPQSIPNEEMADIANRPNTVIVNFKGRLLNDILTSLVTTSYE